MRASSSSSFSSSSSSNLLAATSLTNRLKTVFKKAYALSVLCQIEVCVIHYGPKGELNTWPKEREKVKDMALRYHAATKRKKTLNLREYLKKKKEDASLKKKRKTKRDSENVFKYPVWYPDFDHYSPDQLAQLILSLERTLSTLQDRLRFLQAQRQRNTNPVHQSLTPSSLNQNHHQYQTQPLNPSQFSLCIYNHGDSTFSQLPLSASYFNQLTSYQNHLMIQQQQQQQLYGIDYNITNSNVVQHPCVSNTQDYSALLTVQDSGLKNHWMQQQDLYGSHENMCMMNDITNSNVVQQPCLSNRARDDFFSGFQKNPYGDLVGRSSFSQDFPDLFSTYDESGLLQASSLPSLHAVPNSYHLSDQSIFL